MLDIIENTCSFSSRPNNILASIFPPTDLSRRFCFSSVEISVVFCVVFFFFYRSGSQIWSFRKFLYALPRDYTWYPLPPPILTAPLPLKKKENKKTPCKIRLKHYLKEKRRESMSGKMYLFGIFVVLITNNARTLPPKAIPISWILYEHQHILSDQNPRFKVSVSIDCDCFQYLL